MDEKLTANVVKKFCDHCHQLTDQRDDGDYLTCLFCGGWNPFTAEVADEPKALESFEVLFDKYFDFSSETFVEATALVGLQKLSEEIEEVKNELLHGHPGSDLADEYADCLACLVDSWHRAGLTSDDIRRAFRTKMIINENREWIKNPDNTYSHVKN